MPQIVSRDKPIGLGHARSAHGRILVLSPPGEPDLAFAPARRAAPEQASVGRERLVVLDLRDVTSADSSIRAGHDGGSRLLGRGGRRLLIANTHALPMRVLQLSGSTTALNAPAPAGLPEKDLVALLDDG